MVEKLGDFALGHAVPALEGFFRLPPVTDFRGSGGPSLMGQF
jgi:hypothetical protein